jgi:hypothetical protein
LDKIIGSIKYYNEIGTHSVAIVAPGGVAKNAFFLLHCVVKNILNVSY